MQASTVLTEVRLRAGSFHHGRPAVFKGPPGPSPGRDGARTLVIFGPFGEFPGKGKKASNPRLGKKSKDKENALTFPIFRSRKILWKIHREFPRERPNFTKYEIPGKNPAPKAPPTNERGRRGSCTTSSTTTSTTSSTTTYLEVDGSANSTDPGR